jgi:ATP-dependent DNA ligase
VKCHGRQEFVIGGFTKQEGSRIGFGSLLLGYYKDEALHYAGKVGTGFDHALLGDMSRRLKKLAVQASPFVTRLTGAETKALAEESRRLRERSLHPPSEYVARLMKACH